jgi:hypothetical protein
MLKNVTSAASRIHDAINDYHIIMLHITGKYFMLSQDTNPCLFLMAILLRALRCRSIIPTYTEEDRYIKHLYR